MQSPNKICTHKTTPANFALCLVRLLIGCLISVLMSPLAMAGGKEQSNNSRFNPPLNMADKNAGLRTTSESSSGKSSSEKKDTAPTSDRPGKPDDHNSNGDDIPVRPPRRVKK
ncbi:MAG: hypothetical protein AAB401_18220 [Acidobacteriota bacterium]